MVGEESLTPEQVESYRRNGYLFPLDLLDADAVEASLRELRRARDDAREKGLEAELPMLLRANTHVLLPFVYRIASSAALLDRVEVILGPNLKLWSAEFFIKAAHSGKIVSWHQDLTYWGLGETDDEMTAWLALTPATPVSGCMRFVPGSQRQRILPHRDTFAEDNLLSRGQEVAVDVDESEAVDVVLNPGQMSFHHGRMFHCSGPNRSDHDRIGLVFRFITPAVRQQVAARDYAMTLRGRDDSGNWIEVAPPARNFEPGALALHREIQAVQNDALAEGIDPARMHKAMS